MTLKTTSGENPTANLAINKSRIKKYGKNKTIPSYYLEKGQEFQLELYNPTQEKVLTTIKFNNKAISGGLILRPGERVFLDRYLDSNKKFLFDTYKVDNTKSAKKAIEPNGDVEIAFFKEIIQNNNIFLCGGTGTLNLNYTNNLTTNDLYIPVKSDSGSPTLDWMVDDLGTGDVHVNYSTSNISSNTNNINFKSPSINITEMDSSEILRSSKPKKSKTLSKTPIEIETGRVEQGSKSDQDLCNGSGDFEITSFHVVTYKILPKSQKKLSTKDYYTKYCGDCGAKVKTKFCPYCGAKQ